MTGAISTRCFMISVSQMRGDNYDGRLSGNYDGR